MQNYAIELSMDNDTVYALNKQGAYVSVLQAVQINGSAVPVLCNSQHPVESITSISCSPKFQGLLFPNFTPLEGSLLADFSTNLTAGQTLHVQGNGAWQVTGGGPAGSISIANETSAQITAGIAQMINDQYVTTTAFYVPAGSTSVFTPVMKIFLSVGPPVANVGSVVERIPTAGYFVDLTDNAVQAVSYDAGSGWSDPHGTATPVAAYADLVALLIEPAPAMVE